LEWDYVALGLTLLDVLGRPIDRVPESGEVTLIDEIRMTPAGTAAGPAIVAAGLGLRTSLVGAIGRDDLGRVLESLLADRGVDLGAIQRVDELRTSATMLTIRSDGERPAFHAPGASLLLDRNADLERTISQARCLHLGGIGTLAKLDGAPLAAILTDALTDDTIVTCDLIAPGEHTAAALEPLLPRIDWLMPTLDEARALSGRHEVGDVAAHFSDAGVGGCVFKAGAEGAWLVRGGDVVMIDARSVDVVDTTGCGDSFCAGFGAALVRGWEPERAAHFGAATAATVATGLGTDANVAPFDEIAARFGL
jgi:sugar/nucleoside kinase (ribokinase family)